jgi:hypothetical protein
LGLVRGVAAVVVQVAQLVALDAHLTIYILIIYFSNLLCFNFKNSREVIVAQQ